MEIVLGMVLVVSIMILCALIVNGYFLYRNSKNTMFLDSQRSDKESQLVDLYNLLEHAMDEFDKYISDVKAEIQKDKDEISKLKDEILVKFGAALAEGEKSKEDEGVWAEENTSEAVENKPVPANINKAKDLKEIKIKTLHKQGKSIPDIAKELDIGQGEVSLILNFDKNNKKSEER